MKVADRPSLLGLACSPPGRRGRAAAATELQFWFGVSGANAEVIQSLAKEFNATQPDYRVVPVFKGTYPETLQAGIAAFEAGQAAAHHPGLRRRHRRDDEQRGRLHSGRRRAGEGRRQRSTRTSICPGIVAYYSRPDGTMLSFPVQLLLADPLLQQGHLPARRARCGQSAEDLAGGLVRGAADRRAAARRPAATPPPG